MKKSFLTLTVVMFSVFILEGCSTFFLKDKPEFIKVNGSKFEKEGTPYYFLGTNLWYGCYLGSKGGTGDRERLMRELDLLESLGITNLRILAASEESQIKNSLKPAIQIKPGVYNEDLLDGLDFLLSEMKKRKMYAVIFLNNYWEWSGGMAQYNNWFGSGKVFDPEVDGWSSFMEFSASFYRNQKANQHFREYIKKIVTRKNNYSDVYYFEDPTIMAWQLANEPRPGTDQGAAQYVNYWYNWIDSTAQYIHSIDPNHLVTTGNEGLMGSAQSEEYYINAHRSKYIDYMTFHLWAKNWGWYNAQKPDETYPATESNAKAYLVSHFAYARLLNKPLVLEEFGIARDNESYDLNSSTTVRDKYYTAIFKMIYDSASSGSPIAGSNFWTWGGEGRAQHQDYIWHSGDSFTGDPPQEAQGLNSVFDTDISTLNVLRQYAEKMNMLNVSTKELAGK